MINNKSWQIRRLEDSNEFPPSRKFPKNQTQNISRINRIHPYAQIAETPKQFFRLTSANMTNDGRYEFLAFFRRRRERCASPAWLIDASSKTNVPRSVIVHRLNTPGRSFQNARTWFVNCSPGGHNEPFRGHDAPCRRVDPPLCRRRFLYPSHGLGSAVGVVAGVFSSPGSLILVRWQIVRCQLHL